MLKKLWALCGRSATIAVAHGVTFLGLAVTVLGSAADKVAGAFGDPLLGQQLQAWLKDHVGPEQFGLIMIAIAVATYRARLRTLGRPAAPPSQQQ